MLEIGDDFVDNTPSVIALVDNTPSVIAFVIILPGEMGVDLVTFTSRLSGREVKSDVTIDVCRVDSFCAGRILSPVVSMSAGLEVDVKNEQLLSTVTHSCSCCTVEQFIGLLVIESLLNSAHSFFSRCRSLIWL